MFSHSKNRDDELIIKRRKDLSLLIDWTFFFVYLKIEKEQQYVAHNQNFFLRSERLKSMMNPK